MAGHFDRVGGHGISTVKFCGVFDYLERRYGADIRAHEIYAAYFESCQQSYTLCVFIGHVDTDGGFRASKKFSFIDNRTAEN